MLEKKSLKNWIKKNQVVDIIIFGSSVRGKSFPKDIDLCILINKKDEGKSLDLVDSLSKLIRKAHINILTLADFISGNTLAKTLLAEGYSLSHNKSLAKVLGFDNKSLFIYSLKKFSSSKRVRFHYLLRGRHGSKGILYKIQGKFIGTGSIIVPTDQEDYLKEVFDKWKVEYKIHRVLFG